MIIDNLPITNKNLWYKSDTIIFDNVYYFSGDLDEAIFDCPEYNISKHNYYFHSKTGKRLEGIELCWNYNIFKK